MTATAQAGPSVGLITEAGHDMRGDLVETWPAARFPWPADPLRHGPDWQELDAVDVVAGGRLCPERAVPDPLERILWGRLVEAIAYHQPGLVLWTMRAGRPAHSSYPSAHMETLDSLGYDAAWTTDPNQNGYVLAWRRAGREVYLHEWDWADPWDRGSAYPQALRTLVIMRGTMLEQGEGQ